MWKSVRFRERAFKGPVSLASSERAVEFDDVKGDTDVEVLALAHMSRRSCGGGVENRQEVVGSAKCSRETRQRPHVEARIGRRGGSFGMRRGRLFFVRQDPDIDL